MQRSVLKEETVNQEWHIQQNYPSTMKEALSYNQPLLGLPYNKCFQEP